MGLLQDIEHAVTSSDRPLSDVLRMGKILAAKLDNALLREWADQELNGYAKDAPLPPYRAPRTVPVCGDFTGPSHQARNVPISVIQLKAEYRGKAWKGLFRVGFTRPIAAYEDMLRHDAVEFREMWEHDVVLLVQPTVFEGMQCIAAWRVLSRDMLVRVVDGVRNRLLDLVLELERQVPGAGEVPCGRPAAAAPAGQGGTRGGRGGPRRSGRSAAGGARAFGHLPVLRYRARSRSWLGVGSGRTGLSRVSMACTAALARRAASVHS
jgi:AbiTii